MAQAEADTLAAELASAEDRLVEAEEAATPAVNAAKQAAERSDAAEDRAAEIATDLETARTDAAEQVADEEAAYAEAKEQRDSDITSGLIGLGIAAAIGVGALLMWRVRGWEPKRWQQLTVGLALVVFVLGGAGLILEAPTADKPEIPDEMRELAAATNDDPLQNPTPELARALEIAEPLEEKARRLDAVRFEAEEPVRNARAEVSTLEGKLADAEDAAQDVSKELAAAEAEAAEEAEFRAAATTIDYDQLIKNPDELSGTKVVYEGQIFQIQESFGRSIILLSVSNEGFGFWTDEVWVDADEIESAEDDVITVYGTVTGGKSYRTQIGGSRFVPRIKANYIDE